MSSIDERLTQVRATIRDYERLYAREPGSVQLIAVSKTQPATAIRRISELGQQHIGENYLQEALDKQAVLRDLALCWHFIGPIQANKTRAVAEHFAWVHSIDRIKTARRLGEQRPAHLPPLKVLLQVNLSDEAGKAGVTLDALPELAAAVARLERLSLRGLMAIPAPESDPVLQRYPFRQLATARDELAAAGHEECRELSMGMSGDLSAAIAEGATMVRIGTAIFGPREAADSTRTGR